jgi:response regulator RpfG family c-di-GMP phosphodiesterase
VEERGAQCFTGYGMFGILLSDKNTKNMNVKFFSIKLAPSLYSGVLYIRANHQMAAADNTSNLGEKKPRARILIIDDEHDIADVMKKGLELNGFEAVAFSDPNIALEHFHNHSSEYCLAVIDIRMPNINGFDLARKFHVLNPTVKKVLMSAFEIHKKEVEQVLPSVRADDFITKPIAISKLKATIMNHIETTKQISEGKGY